MTVTRKGEIIYINVIFHITVKTNTEKLKREIIATGIRQEKEVIKRNETFTRLHIFPKMF